MNTSKMQENAKILKQDLIISKEQFIEYLNVQRTGLFNMLDERARHLTSLSKEEYLYIIVNYNYLCNVYDNQ